MDTQSNQTTRSALESRGDHPAICSAAFYNDCAQIQALLDSGADIEARINSTSSGSAHGQTAVLVASQEGAIDALRLLLQNNADFHARDALGRSAIAIANDIETVNLLREYGAEFGLVEASIWSDKQTVEQILEDQTAYDSYVAETALRSAAHCGHTEIVRVLLDAGVDINAVRSRGDTALMHAIRESHDGTIRLLVSRGANLNEKLLAPDCCSWTPLMAAVLFASPEIVSLLLEAGANPNQLTDPNSDYDSVNALMFAIWNGEADMVRLLLDHGADVHASTGLGRTALSEVRQHMERLPSLNATAAEQMKKIFALIESA